jgi:aminobenzoyl-glutamate transport protein
MIPYSVWLLIAGMALAMIWMGLGLPLGPGVGSGYELQMN